MRILKSRLVELQEEQREAELAKERGAAQDIGFGSQIRSYVLQPYQLVKDHRTGFEVGNAQGVLDGNLDGFVRAVPAGEGRRKGRLTAVSARLMHPPRTRSGARTEAPPTSPSSGDGHDSRRQTPTTAICRAVAEAATTAVRPTPTPRSRAR